MKAPASKSFRSVLAVMSPRERIAFCEQIALYCVTLYAIYLRQPSIWLVFNMLPMFSLTLKNRPDEPKSTPASKWMAAGFFLLLLTIIFSGSEYFKHPHRSAGHVLLVIAICLNLHMFYLRWKVAEEQGICVAEVSA